VTLCITLHSHHFTWWQVAQWSSLFQSCHLVWIHVLHTLVASLLARSQVSGRSCDRPTGSKFSVVLIGPTTSAQLVPNASYAALRPCQNFVKILPSTHKLQVFSRPHAPPVHLASSLIWQFPALHNLTSRRTSGTLSVPLPNKNAFYAPSFCPYFSRVNKKAELDVHGSVHRNINLTERTNKM